MPKKRQPKEIWEETRRRIWERDGRRCVSSLQSPLCTGKNGLALEECHIDHVKSGILAGNEDSNLRTLCRTCHVLREDNRHRGMMAGALRDGVIPPDWRRHVWE